MEQTHTDEASQRKPGNRKAGNRKAGNRKSRARNLRRRKATFAILGLALATILALCQLGFIMTKNPTQVEDDNAGGTPGGATASIDNETAEWAQRIDAFNAGYPLEGYGYAFAAAAQEYGVDPRLSPAIARAESGSGQVCSYPHNAWGWGTMSWSDWETAIYAHVSGLASGYGSELTYDMAQKYCPDGADEWYATIASVIDQI